MTINKDNYPAYFLDYHEGRLSAADEAALFVFLGKHPDLREAFDAFQPVSVSSWDDDAVFPGKGSLKRGVITPENRDYYFAAYVEGDLSQADRATVEAYAAADPAMARELALMHKAILPAEELRYPDKDALKRQLIIHIGGTEAGRQPAAAAGAGAPGANDRVIGIAAEDHVAKDTRIMPLFMKRWLPYASAAAVLILLAGLFFLRLPEQPVDGFAHDMHDIQDIPAVGGVDDPVAVADIPLPWQEREDQAASGQRPESVQPQKDQATTVRSTERVQGQRNEATQRQLAQEAPGLSAGGETGATHEQASATAMVVSDALPGPRKMGSIGADSKQFPVQKAGPSGLDYRSEFAYWSPASLPAGDSDYFADAGSGSGRQEMGLAQLAVNRLGQSLPIDFSKAEAHLSENRIPIWLVAEAGLNGLGNMAAKALGLERETDEEGRTIAITAGDRFEARRSSR